MSDVLVLATILSLVFAAVMAIIASKLLRENRARSVARVQALQDIVAEGADADEDWDSVLGHPLFEAPAHHTPGRQWLWIPATGVVLALSIGGAHTIFSGVFQNASAVADARPATPAAAGPTAPIELLSLRHAVETTAPGTFVVTGLVQNPPVSAAIRDVYAVVYLFDEDGRYFASSKAALDVATLSPGGEGAFTVRVTPSSALSAADVRRYRVSFQQQDGAAVSHVDKRGTLPEGTTGGAVESETPRTPKKPKLNTQARR